MVSPAVKYINICFSSSNFIFYNRCPECAFGDLDFSSSGDGRWDITWGFAPCEDSSDQTFLFEGSNEFYWKVRGGCGVVRVGQRSEFPLFQCVCLIVFCVGRV